MSKELAPLDELSVSAKLDESGISASVKTRSLTALDRLVGGLIDWAGVGIERRRDKARVRAEIDEALLREEGAAAVGKLRSDPLAGDRVLDAFSQSFVRKRDNRIAVARVAMEEILALPAPTGEPESIAAKADLTEEAELSADWLNMFEAHAENASSEHLQALWGRILAGEVRKPGAFSLTTLRFVSELDITIAKQFEAVAASRLSDGFIPKPKELKGQRLLDYNFLEEVGLIQDGIGYSIRPTEDGRYYRFEQGVLLVMKPVGTKTPRVNLYRLTRAGREICSILPQVDGVTGLKEIAENVRGDMVFAELRSFQRIDALNVMTHPLEVLYGTPEELA